MIVELCKWRAMKAAELAMLLGNRELHALKRDHLKPLLNEGKLALSHSEMERHPDQSYKVPDSTL